METETDTDSAMERRERREEEVEMYVDMSCKRERIGRGGKVRNTEGERGDRGSERGTDMKRADTMKGESGVGVGIG
jgi:hypothetical protein